MNEHGNEHETLQAALQAQGWHLEEERVVSPHGTLWLPADALQYLGPDALLDEAMLRLRRRLRHRWSYDSSYDHDCAVEDAEALVEVLEAMAYAPLAKAG